MTKRITGLLMAFLIIMTVPAMADTYVGGKYISSKGACILDFETGEMLFGYNENVPMVPASMTKLMALYVIYDAINAGKISFGTQVPISKYVYNSSRNPEGSNIPLNYNGGYTVSQMIDMIAVASACACVEALGELIYGSVNEFLNAMNAKAAALGLNARYISVTGIANNYITPHSMAWLARGIIIDYPDILNRTSKTGVSANGKWYSSSNKLLRGTYYYEGADGMKTGTSSAAGYCFTGTASRNQKRVIAVTMNSSSTTQRFADVRVMLDYGFSVISERQPKNIIQTTSHDAILANAEMPTFVYGYKDINCFAVIAEDLQCYGYDAYYDAQTGTLTLTYNPEKAITPINLSYYKSFPEYTPMFNVYQSAKSVKIIKNGETYTPNITLDLNGYMAIGIDEGLINFLGICVR